MVSNESFSRISNRAGVSELAFTRLNMHEHMWDGRLGNRKEGAGSFKIYVIFAQQKAHLVATDRYAYSSIYPRDLI